MLRILREDIEFYAADGDDVSAIKPEAVVFRRLPAPGNDGFQPFELEEVPGIVVSARGVPIPETEGENNQDDWYFQWLIQICCQELGSPNANSWTYWDWQEQIADHFNMFQFNDAINDGRGCLYISAVQMVDDVDVRTWARATTFVGGVLLTTKVRKVRGKRAD